MKRILVIAVLILSISPLWAQVKVGVKAGGMLTNLAGKGIGFSGASMQDNTKLSYLAGVTLALPIHDRFRVQAEALYSNKGISLNDDLDDSFDFRENYHYFSAAVLFRYYLTKRLSIGVGPELGYLLGAYQRSESFGSFPLNQYYKPWDVSLNLDVQYDVSDRLSLGLRYNLGVLDITERYEVTTFDGEPFIVDNDVYNRSVQLSLTYWLWK